MLLSIKANFDGQKTDLGLGKKSKMNAKHLTASESQEVLNK
jgi:hypothetical protein